MKDGIRLKFSLETLEVLKIASETWEEGIFEVRFNMCVFLHVNFWKNSKNCLMIVTKFFERPSAKGHWSWTWKFLRMIGRNYASDYQIKQEAWLIWPCNWVNIASWPLKVFGPTALGIRVGSKKCRASFKNDLRVSSEKPPTSMFYALIFRRVWLYVIMGGPSTISLKEGSPYYTEPWERLKILWEHLALFGRRCKKTRQIPKE